MKVLITTVFKGSSVIQAINQLSPEKIYFVVDKPCDDIRKNSIDMIREFFPTKEFFEISAKMYDLLEIAKETIKVINKEADNKIFVHISEGRKTMGFGVLFGAYAMRDQIDSAYYIIEETNKLIKIPLIALKVPPKKSKILNLLKSGKTLKEIEKDLNITDSTLYVHLKELKDDGFITKNNLLTEMGEIVLLKK